jgi:hypothetical protein
VPWRHLKNAAYALWQIRRCASDLPTIANKVVKLGKMGRKRTLAEELADLANPAPTAGTGPLSGNYEALLCICWDLKSTKNFIVLGCIYVSVTASVE